MIRRNRVRKLSDSYNRHLFLSSSASLCLMHAMFACLVVVPINCLTYLVGNFVLFGKTFFFLAAFTPFVVSAVQWLKQRRKARVLSDDDSVHISLVAASSSGVLLGVLFKLCQLRAITIPLKFFYWNSDLNIIMCGLLFSAIVSFFQSPKSR
eukprot:TRINITY_DN14107_c0_g2_i1.p1 TRINITY_DN14107_c0_g2~~TRINITY_DN14107_c0_g2_i1.p1  ORF type:complete len:152 (-),score=2.45 TRINITY_DN14107_c0_g2_i1:398-853(-)